ncbi:hypothetical protein ACFYKX_11170 [Cytobacillus sp. FJAT-54145]|uniref:Uncharacterized protein n=1 Tax=Cytobacillus spartinae TaxID=3299023 RepID=A0ABW6KAB8_9BACI
MKKKWKTVLMIASLATAFGLGTLTDDLRADAAKKVPDRFKTLKHYDETALVEDVETKCQYFYTIGVGGMAPVVINKKGDIAGCKK